MERVFAYGSNMHLPDLRRWLRDAGHDIDGIQIIGPARLRGHGLVWNYRSRARDGAAANAVPIAGGELRGVVIEVNAATLAAIDQKEGHPHRYSRGDTPVAVELFEDFGDGTVDAWLYTVLPAFTHDVPILPRRAYMALMIEAATEHALGADYVAMLRAVPTAD